MKLRKIQCLNGDCGTTCITNEKTCPECEGHNFIVLEPTALDYVTMWEDELENANMHSLTDMPSDLHKIISKLVKDERIVLEIFKKTYELGLGI